MPCIFKTCETDALTDIFPAKNPFKAIFNLLRLQILKGKEHDVILDKNLEYGTYFTKKNYLNVSCNFL